jgi:2'-5' RNA ligase
MNAVVSLLDEKYYAEVEALWAELEAKLGRRGIYITPYPHFTYHVAREYDVPALESYLQQLAQSKTGFSVRTTGLGIFTGKQPVLYIPVVRDPQLTQLHEEIWPEISKFAGGSEEYYRPEIWLPHISLGFGDLDQASLAEAVRLLGERSFDWQIEIDNLALIYDTGEKQELRSRFKLQG